MKNYVFSPSKVEFYPCALKKSYEDKNVWPDDGVYVSDEIYLLYSGMAPDGMKRGVDGSGMPAWVPKPLPTREELINLAESEKSSRLDSASSAITIWQTKLLMGRKLTDTEMTALNAWMDYIDQLQTIDVSQPAEIAWPPAPVQ